MDVFQQLIERVNVQFGAIVVALVFGLSGSAMIFRGIKAEGAIDVKTAFVEGRVKSGMVGVLLVFCSLLIVLTTVIVHRKREQTISLKRGDQEVSWKGTFTSVEELKVAETFLRSSLGADVSETDQPPRSTQD